MDPERLRGVLSFDANEPAQDAALFGGYVVQAAFEEKLVGDLADDAGDDSFVPAVRVAAAEPNGRFSIPIPSLANRRGPFLLRVFDGRGIAVLEREFQQLVIEPRLGLRIPDTLQVAQPPRKLDVARLPPRRPNQRIVGRVIDTRGRPFDAVMEVRVEHVPADGSPNEAIFVTKVVLSCVLHRVVSVIGSPSARG